MQLAEAFLGGFCGNAGECSRGGVGSFEMWEFQGRADDYLTDGGLKFVAFDFKVGIMIVNSFKMTFDSTTVFNFWMIILPCDDTKNV